MEPAKRWFRVEYFLLDETGKRVGDGVSEVYATHHAAACRAAQPAIELAMRMLGLPDTTAYMTAKPLGLRAAFARFLRRATHRS